MANLLINDGAGSAKYIGGTGAGSDVDPYILTRAETFAACGIAAGAYAAGAIGKDAFAASAYRAATFATSAVGFQAIAAAAYAPSAIGVGAFAAGAVAKDAVATGAFAASALAAQAFATGAIGKDSIAASAFAATAFATGAVGKGAFAASALASGAFAAGAIGAGAIATGAIADMSTASTARTTESLVLPVQIISASGTAGIVRAVGNGLSISVCPTITAGAYSAKDAVGQVLTLSNATRNTAGKSIINTVTVIDNDDEKAGLELWLFSTSPTGVADNAPMDFTDADLLNCVGVIPVSTADYYSLADNGVACVRGVGLQFQVAALSLYCQAKAVGTPTFTAVNDLNFVFAIEYLS